MTDLAPNPPVASDATGHILVVGSVNHDHFLMVDALPTAGETVAARMAFDGLGGKGANQAVAASLAGAAVAFVGAVGTDPSGAFAHEAFLRYDVDDRFLQRVEGATGAAYIAVDAAGENSIIVLPGANVTVGSDALQAARGLHPALVLAQGEIPSAGIAAAARFALEHGSRFVLNLAPVVDLLPDLLHQADPLVVNEHEAARILGRDAPRNREEAFAAARMLGDRSRSVVLTLGAAGAVMHSGELGTIHIAAAVPPGPVVDTTGAGDAFVGVLAARLAAGDSLLTSCHVAARAASIAVSRYGTIDSYASASEMADGGPAEPVGPGR